MRITGVQFIVAMIFSGLAIAHDNHAQEVLNREISLQLKEVTFGQALDRIAAVGQVKFVYSPAHLKLSEKLSVSFSKERLGKVLEQLLTVRKLKFTVQVDGDFILITPVKVNRGAASTGVVTPAIDVVAVENISGKVMTIEGIPIAGVSVVVKAGNYGTFTGGDGRYTIEAYPDDLVVFSSIGYKAVELRVGNATTMDVVMQEDITTLSEVVVNASYSTGYQVLPKERATGSYAKPTMEVFRDRVSTLDVMGRLEGQVAGLSLNMGVGGSRISENGSGKSSRSALVRGKGSVSTDTEPLYVLNGVAVTDFSDINPDDIGDITVLKDAAATAIWGARAANGVIVVTTKSGKKDSRLRVNYSGFVTIAGKQDYGYARQMNSVQYIQAARETFDPVVYPQSSLTYDYSAPHEKILYDQYAGVISAEQADASLDSLAAINNLGQIKDIYRTAYTSNHTVSVGGGGTSYAFYGSLSYANTHSAMPGEGADNYRLNFTQDINPNKNIKISLSTNLTKTVTKGKNSFLVDSHFLPYQRFRDDQGNLVNMNYLTGWSEELRLDYQERSRINLEYSPLKEWNARHTDGNSLGVNMVGNAGIRLWKGLSYLGTYGYAVAPGETDYYEDYSTLYMRKRLVSNTTAPTASDIPVYHLPTTGGRYQKSNYDQRDWTARNQLTYMAEPRGKKDNLSVQAGYEARESTMTSHYLTLEGYDEALQTYAILDYATLSAGIPGTVTGWGGYYETPFQTTEKKQRYTSVFALANYTINQRYSIDASWRRDHSNLFGSDKSSQNRPIWSIGGKWRLSQESFMKPSSHWLNDLGVRATYGITGNSPYLGAATSQDVLTPSNSYPPGISGAGLIVTTKTNRTIKWESTETINIGLDFAVLNNKLNGSINLYHKDTYDLLGAVQRNPFTSENKGMGNLGHMMNRGIELQLYTSNVNTKNFNWSSGIVFSYNQNELKSYSQTDPFMESDNGALNAGYWVGYSMQPVFAYRWAGLDNMGDPQIRLADNTVTKERNGIAFKDMVYMGTTIPVFNGGISNTLRYKAWQLSCNIVYNLGHVMRKDVNTVYSGRISASSGWSGNIPVYFQDRWKKPGDEYTTDVPSYVSEQYTSYARRNTDFYTKADINVVSASYAKIRDITLSYSVPAKVLGAVRMESARIFIQTNNFMIWKANDDGIDPELQGLSYGARGERLGHGLSFGVQASF